jgi:hypothetical protein
MLFGDDAVMSYVSDSSNCSSRLVAMLLVACLLVACSWLLSSWNSFRSLSNFCECILLQLLKIDRFNKD